MRIYFDHIRTRSHFLHFFTYAYFLQEREVIMRVILAGLKDGNVQVLNSWSGETTTFYSQFILAKKMKTIS